jgi:uncharacterized protein (DUF433 family)
MKMPEPHPVLKTYRYLAERSGSSCRELFVCGTDLRAQSLVSDLENEGLTTEEVAAAYHIPLEAVHEAIEYVHANEEHLRNQRSLAREVAIAKGYLKSA